MDMDKIIRDDSAIVNLDLKFAIVLIISAVAAVILIMPNLSHEERDWRIKQYMTAARVSDNLVQDAGTPPTWGETDWNRTAGNYLNVTKIGLTYTDAEGMPMQKVLNLSKITVLMGDGYLDNGTQTRWWEFPNSTTSQAERESATRALGLDGYNFYMQLHPVDNIRLDDSSCIFNPVPLEANLTNRNKVPINNDTVTVVDRYVYIKDVASPSEYLNYSCPNYKYSIHYRLNLWVW
jgi:hypothetical protein